MMISAERCQEPATVRSAAGDSHDHLFQYLRQSHIERRIQYEIFMHPYSENFDIVVKSTKEANYIEKNTFDFQ